MIGKTTYEFADEFEVTFMKCCKKSATANRFTVPAEEDIVDAPFDDTVARLPVPTVLGGTTRTKKMVVFSVDVSQYRPQLWGNAYGGHMAYGIGLRGMVSYQ